MTRSPLPKLILLTTLATLVLAPVANAENDGRGFYGATNDKVVTDAGFILIGGFVLFVFLMTMLQRSLEKRKDRRRAAEKEAIGTQWHGGW